MKKLLFLCIAIFTAILFQSCGPTEITVGTRPDAPFYTRPAAPGADYIWIDGDWVTTGGHYRWHEGHWSRPGGRVWVGGSWESRPGGWHWGRGHWR